MKPSQCLGAMSLAGVCLAVAAPAVAAVEPPYTNLVNVDVSYVTGASQATDIAFGADGRALVTRKSGQIVVRRADGTLTTVAYPFGGTLDTGSEKGLLGVVADPNVAQNGAFYFYVSNGPTNDKHRVYRAVLTPSDTLDVNPTPIVGASVGVGPGLEGPANHDGGGMVINDGKLYIGVGDTGANASPPVNKYGSCLNKGNGKILRVNLDGSVPNDNPLVGLATVTACNSTTGPWTTAAPDRRIYAWGLRNPWRFWVDPATDLLWLGDVGEATQEEISVGAGNQHYGYPFEEGSHVWGNLEGQNCASMVPPTACTEPVFSYPRAQGRSVTGGLIVEGCGWSNVFSSPHYVYGDYTANALRALPVNASRTEVSASTATPFASYSSSGPVSFRMGPDASLYVVMLTQGAVYRFTPVNRTGAGCGPALSVPSRTETSPWWLFALLGLAGTVLAARAGSFTQSC